MSKIGLNELGYDEQLYVLAFDHRGLVREDGRRRRGSVARARRRLIWEGFQRAVELGAPKESAGILVDGQYGPTVAREAKAGGYKLAMPVEKSGQEEFDFEYGDAFGEKIEEFDPDFTKVLVRYNPDGDEALNERQTEKLRRLSRVAARASPQVPVRAARSGGAGAARAGRRQRRPLRRRAAPGADDARRSTSCRTAGSRRTSGRSKGIDDRDACDEIAQARAARRPRPRVVRRARPRRVRREGRRVAARRRQESRGTSASRSAARSSPSR